MTINFQCIFDPNFQHQLNMNIGNLLPLNTVKQEWKKREATAGSRKNKENTSKNLATQLKIERKLASVYNACAGINKSINPSNLRSNEFERLLNNDFYNSDVMKAVSCITQSFTRTNDYVYELRVRKYLRSPKQIGTPSVYGFALETQIEDHQPVFIIKAPKTIQKDLLHEYITGVYGLNKLRTEVPNFAYILGAFKCSSPYIQADKRVKAFCFTGAKNKVTYVVYERIAPGVEFGEYILTCTKDDFIAAWMQILFSLKLAQDKIKFNHNDLHADNAIVRLLGSTVQIPYTSSKGQKVYVTANAIPTLIDYGQSRFDVRDDGNTATLTDPEIWAHPPYDFNPLIDAYKLISFLLYILIQNNKLNTETGKAVAEIYRFFYDFRNMDDLTSRINDERFSYYIYFQTRHNAGVNLETFIDWIFSSPKPSLLLGKIVTRQRDSRIKLLSCGIKDCVTEDDTLKFLGVTDKAQLTDIFDLYEYVLNLPQSKQKPFSRTEGAVNILNDQMKGVDNDLKRIERYFNSHRWTGVKDQNIDFTFMNKYRKEIETFMDLLDTYLLTSGTLNVIAKYMSMMGDKDNNNLAQLMKRRKIANTNVVKLLDDVREDIRLVSRIDKATWKNNLADDRRLLWWTDTFLLLGETLEFT
uniref:Protein kinase n=1 Tax=Pithovirus LCPAC404 TaxID=2506597 RepID=A0A481ZEM9_9VIRU|nr:MAG: uncharacterized protein LCPAC404_02540 [Pithovirus LCPAC404]